MRTVIGRLQRELLQARKVTLDAVEPGAVRRRQIEANVVQRRPQLDLFLHMRSVVIDDDVQLLLTRIARTHPFEKRQEFSPTFARREATVESIRFQIVEGQEVPHAAFAIVGRAQPSHMFVRPFVAVAVARLQIERTEFVDAQPSAVGGPMTIQTANGSVFCGKQGVCRFLPGLGSTQTHLVAMQDFTEPADADVGDDLLLDEVSAEFRQRPLRHADERNW